MKKLILGLLLFLSLASSSSAKPWHYNLLEDFKEVGEVLSVTDDSDMEMSFDIVEPYWLVRYKTKRVLENSKLGFATESGDSEQAYLGSRWFTRSIDGAANMFSGIDQVRTRVDARVIKATEGLTRLTLTAQFQVQKSNNNRGWVDKSEREIRNLVRELGTLVILACRYPTDVSAQQSVGYAYMDEKKRHGKKGYKLPPGQKASMMDFPAEKYSWCHHHENEVYCLTGTSEGEEYCSKHEPSKAPVVLSPASVADELLKLKQLLDDGVLTQEEFDAQKAKLLSE